MQNSCLFNTIVFLAFLTLLRSMYLSFSAAVNSVRKTLLTLRSVTLGEGRAPSPLGVPGAKITLGESGLSSDSRGEGSERGDIWAVCACALGSGGEASAEEVSRGELSWLSYCDTESATESISMFIG